MANLQISTFLIRSLTKKTSARHPSLDSLPGPGGAWRVRGSLLPRTHSTRNWTSRGPKRRRGASRSPISRRVWMWEKAPTYMPGPSGARGENYRRMSSRSRVFQVLVFLRLVFFYLFTKHHKTHHLDVPFRTVSRGSRRPSRGCPGPPGSFPTKFIQFRRN